ncbi:MAG TPA: hypothetical protein VIL85_20605 [Thermomicrobiales bacterium]
MRHTLLLAACGGARAPPASYYHAARRGVVFGAPIPGHAGVALHPIGRVSRRAYAEVLARPLAARAPVPCQGRA